MPVSQGIAFLLGIPSDDPTVEPGGDEFPDWHGAVMADEVEFLTP